MRPLTDSCPKPLLEVAGKPLLAYHIEKLVAIGVTEIVINVAWLGDKIIDYVGDGSRFGADVQISQETQGALETAGGIINALPLLGDEPFIAVNGDIWTDFDFADLPTDLNGQLAHLVFVDNPEHNLKGDFALEDGKVCLNGEPKFTYSGIAVYQPKLFAGLSPLKAPLPPLWRQHMPGGLIGGSKYDGLWTDVGTPQRFAQLEKALKRMRRLCGERS